MGVAIVHDYLTQRGGAERVVLSLAKALPGAPIFTSLYDPDETFPEFRSLDVRVTALNRLRPLRRHHRLALPLLAPVFSRLTVDAAVVVCSSSGWAHGVRARHRKVVYCHAPARWLYQKERYAPDRLSPRTLAVNALGPLLRRWDRAAASSADRYLTNSTMVKEQVREIYRLNAEVVPPPPSLDPSGARREPNVPPGFFLCVSRLIAYKNVRAVVEAFVELPEQRLIVVGEGPQSRELRALAPSNVSLIGAVSDDVLRGLYANCVALVAAAYEDFGLTPLEAASFGKPTTALRFGGYIDTVDEDRTGMYFAAPTADAIRRAVTDAANRSWDPVAIRSHAARFSEARFIERIRAIAAEEIDRSELTGADR